MSEAFHAVSLGRPRDPGVDERIADAAMTVFGDVGWAGFSVEAVARRAAVGKASIYLRWPTKEALLGGALEARMVAIADIDTGSARGDLVELTRQLLRLYLGGSGRAAMRMTLDGDRVPELRERSEAVSRARILAARAIVRRAMRRGELPTSASVTMLLDTLCGGAMMHAMSAPPDLLAEVRAGADAYAERLVDFVLGSALATGQRRGGADRDQ